MASARLRKTFKYPNDSESDEDPDELDEQEQDELISKFRHEDNTRNEQIKLLFTILPFPCTVPFLLNLFSSSTFISNSTRVILCLLAVTSLLSTAYTAYFIPLPKPKSKQMSGKLMVPVADDDGPVKKYLSYLNGGICVLLFLAAWALNGAQDAAAQSEIFWVWCIAPGVVFITATVGRKAMTDVDIDGLEELKYDYKGA